MQQVGKDCCGQLGGDVGERGAVATKMSDCTAIAAFARGPLYHAGRERVASEAGPFLRSPAVSRPATGTLAGMAGREASPARGG